MKTQDRQEIINLFNKGCRLKDITKQMNKRNITPVKVKEVLITALTRKNMMRLIKPITIIAGLAPKL